MWQCPACQYRNEDFDESCARCGRERISADPLPGAELVAAEADATTIVPPPPSSTDSELHAQRVQEILTGPVPSVVSPKEPSVSNDRRKRPPILEWLAGIVIGVCLVGLLAVFYIAWQRGSLPFSAAPGKPEPGQPVSPAVPEGQSGDASAEAPAEEAGSPLSDLASGKIKGLRSVKQYLDFLTDFDQRVAAINAPDGHSPELSAADVVSLQQLVAAGDELIANYAKFEQRASNASSDVYQAYVAVRGEYSREFNAVMQRLADFRASELEGERGEYMLSDRLTAALDASGMISSVPLGDIWVAGLEQRTQGQLDRGNSEEYKQLAARIAVLKELHNKYNDVFKNYPAYKINGGLIGPDVVKLLGLYDDMAKAVEGLEAEFEEYTAKLDPAKDSDKRKAYLKEFSELAQADHLYCFTETYKVYEKDRELSEPAYQHLADHYHFAEQHWPDRKGAYMAIYTQYENAWESHWHRKDAQ